jgi:hypothetical protein
VQDLRTYVGAPTNPPGNRHGHALRYDRRAE